MGSGQDNPGGHRVSVRCNATLEGMGGFGRLPIANRRYGRLTICATCVSCPRLPAALRPTSLLLRLPQGAVFFPKLFEPFVLFGGQDGGNIGLGAGQDGLEWR